MRITSLMILPLIAFVIAAGLCGYYLNAPPPAADTERYFEIAPGEPLVAIAIRLQEQRIIRSALLMRLMAQITGADTRIQNGSYAIPTTLSTRQLIQFLSNGQQLLIKVTIPEGMTISGIAAIFEQHGVTTAHEFIRLAKDPALAARYDIPAATVEGYLFPNTYYFYHNQNAEAVIAQMIEGFRANLRTNLPQLLMVDSAELHQVVILASMIEKEYIAPEEAPLISSVFHNRLERNQRLEACSTIVYLITEVENKPHPTRLYFIDLQRDSPYNTYRTFGLPPGPIANPGNIALDAALNPADTDYIYFVLESANATAHRFSETFSEHTAARIIYLRSRR